ncbi:hypothetical protein HY358_00205 [Candidatus Roizmanbacteria bacterium]|nr:hypothetical protein [Candidatus Roizmanbacteria bacterium]
MTDSTGDSGSSSFSFTDIVSSELSNEGDSIGVRITTAGNIPNGFGKTGIMVFGVIFPHSLLSQNPSDTGINFITVHWKEDGSGWEGSRFIYTDTITSKPWDASIVIDGTTAFFKIPKSLIGKGKLAYQISIGLISSEGETSDTLPNNSLSDCYIEQTVPPTSTSQTTTIISPVLPQNIPEEGLRKEGNKIIEKPGVVRTTNIDVGQSLVLAESSPLPSRLPKKIVSPVQDIQTGKPPEILVGLLTILLVGAGVIGGVYVALGKKLDNRLVNSCTYLLLQIEELKKKIASLKDEINNLKNKANSAIAAMDKAKEKAQQAKQAVQKHSKGGRPKSRSYIESEGRRIHAEDIGSIDPQDSYDRKTKELEEKKAQAEADAQEAERIANEAASELKQSETELEQSEKTLEELEKALALCKKKVAEAEKIAKESEAIAKGGHTVVQEEYVSSPGADDDGKPSGSCKNGERKEGKIYNRSFLVLDQAKEAKFTVDRALQETGAEAEAFGRALKVLKLILQGLGLASGKIGVDSIFTAPIALINMALGPGGDAALIVSKIPKKLRIVEIIIPAWRIITTCQKVFLCENEHWVEHVVCLGKVQVKEDVKLDLTEIGRMLLVEDLPKFLKEEMRRFADPAEIENNPC